MILARVSPFLERLAKESRGERFDRAAECMLAFDLYQRVRSRGTFGSSDSAEVEAIRNRITQHPALPSEVLNAKLDTSLLAILTALQSWGDDAYHGAVQQAVYVGWLDHAEACFEDGALQVPAAIFRTIGADAEVDNFLGLSARARWREAYMSRIDSDMDTAELLYRRAWTLGRRAGAYFYAYSAKIGEASLLAERGNLPAAEALLARTTRGVKRRAPEALDRAYHARADILHRRGEFSRAVLWAGRAIAVASEPSARMRMLGTFASLLSDIPDPASRAAARKILQFVNANACTKLAREHASLALLSLSIEENDVEQFRAWRARAAGQHMSVRFMAYFKFYSARGNRLLEDASAAASLLDDAEALAVESGFAQLRFMIDKERTALDSTLQNAGDQVVRRRLTRKAYDVIDRITGTLETSVASF